MSISPSVTGVVLTYNESRHIADCLASLAWADALLVFDSFSTDDTVEQARRHGVRVIQHPFENFAQQRNAALMHVETPWVFFLDADERVPPELAAEIRGVLTREEAGWWVPRRNIIVGKWIRHAGWYPDYQLRLFRVEKGHYDPQRVVHEVVLLQGEAGRLQNPLIHYNYDSWGEFIQKQLAYARLDARMQVERGVHPHPWTYVLQPLREFRRRYVTWQGYRDGWHGLMLSLLMAYTAFRTTREVSRLFRQAG
ncbi:MAG: glycosyltransferase family 2 protein [Anaerolineae bacterium]